MPGFERLALATFRYADGLIAPQPGILEWAGSYAPASTPTQVVHNGVDLARFPESREADLPPWPRPYVLFLGFMSPWQGLSTLLDAAGRDAWPDVDLVTIGSGPMEGACRSAGGRVHYIEPVPADEVVRWVSHAIASICPKEAGEHTSHGVSPYKILEAVASGTPVIATAVPGQAELVASLDIGILVPAGDPAALADAVRKIIDDPELERRLAASARGHRLTVSWLGEVEEFGRLFEAVGVSG